MAVQPCKQPQFTPVPQTFLNFRVLWNLNQTTALQCSGAGIANAVPSLRNEAAGVLPKISGYLFHSPRESPSSCDGATRASPSKIGSGRRICCCPCPFPNPGGHPFPITTFPQPVTPLPSPLLSVPSLFHLCAAWHIF